MNRKAILDKAASLTANDREKQYGSWSENAAATAAVWSALLDAPVSPRQVALCMAALKMVRLKHGLNEDSWIDLAGYAALGGEQDGFKKLMIEK